MREALVFAARHGADRILALGVLGLRVAAMGSDERPGWQAATRLYGFLRLPPGPRRPPATDPAGRVRPAAFEVAVPDRAVVRAGMEAGAAMPATLPRALRREVAPPPPRRSRRACPSCRARRAAPPAGRWRWRDGC